MGGSKTVTSLIRTHAADVNAPKTFLEATATPLSLTANHALISVTAVRGDFTVHHHAEHTIQ